MQHNRITPCNPVAVCCPYDNDFLALRDKCPLCGWNPEEAERRVKNIEEGKPVLQHWKTMKKRGNGNDNAI